MLTENLVPTPTWTPAGLEIDILSTVVEKKLDDGGTMYEIVRTDGRNDPVFASHMADYLAAPAPFAPDEERDARLNDPEKYFRYLRGRRKFWRALPYLAKEYTAIATRRYITATYRSDESRMNDPFSVEAIEDVARIAFLDIARAGSPPTVFSRGYFSDNYNLVDDVILWVASEREVNGSTTTKQTSKTVTDLNDRVILGAEQILATSKSAQDAVREAFRDCIGRPKKIVFLFFAATKEGILELAKEFPDAGFVVLTLHGGMNDHRYVIKIGAGDAGAMTYGGIDRKVWLKLLYEDPERMKRVTQLGYNIALLR